MAFHCPQNKIQPTSDGRRVCLNRATYLPNTFSILMLGFYRCLNAHIPVLHLIQSYCLFRMLFNSTFYLFYKFFMSQLKHFSLRMLHKINPSFHIWLGTLVMTSHIQNYLIIFWILTNILSNKLKICIYFSL